jgi:phosphoadenosine phosphosulfate reductase
MDVNSNLKNLKAHLSRGKVQENLKKASGLFPGRTVFTTSFGIEDQVITHFIFSGDLPIEVVTLDTGRLFTSAYETFSSTIIKYRKKIRVFYPDSNDAENLVSEKGPFSFYDSVENRKECCRIRKVKPLSRALQGMECWISGIRADQSPDRGRMDFVEFDEDKGLYKFYPLFDWSYDDVMKFARENHIPYNPLHDKGFISIVCEPCTRAVLPGEDFRAGRWWWEGGRKECGLHERQHASDASKQ